MRLWRDEVHPLDVFVVAVIVFLGWGMRMTEKPPACSVAYPLACPAAAAWHLRTEFNSMCSAAVTIWENPTCAARAVAVRAGVRDVTRCAVEYECGDGFERLKWGDVVAYERRRDEPCVAKHTK